MSDQPLTFAERQLPSHLGGHFGQSNTDSQTLMYLVARFRITSMLDVGCGPGGMLDIAKGMGLEVGGVDGDWHLARPEVQIHDYTQGPLPADGWDLIWCMEFVEHIEEAYIPNFLATFAGGRVLFLTAAPPGFPGWHHVNCQPQAYWIALLEQHGWRLDVEATQWIRQNGGHPFSIRQGLVFVR